MSKNRAGGNKTRFSEIPPSRVPRSAFDLSHSHKSTIDAAFLYPLYTEEVLPGDSFTIEPSFFARLSTPLKPYMDGLILESQWFFVPNRLVWSDFIRMEGERRNPDDHNDYTVPQLIIPSGGHPTGSLADYFGFPTLVGNGLGSQTCLYHRAYALIYQEWYRDESIQDRVPQTIPTGPGPDVTTGYPLYRRGKRKDYLSGALPFAQKGDPVQLPLGDSAPVVATGDSIPKFLAVGGSTAGDLTTSGGTLGTYLNTADGTADFAQWDTTSLEADLSSAIGSTINQMRVAIGVQHTLELDARGGSRYVEQNLVRFGVQTDDLRLFRPELLHTTSTPIQVQQVPQTINASASEVLGALGAYATGTSVGRGFSRSFKEHGMIFGIVSVRAELTYQQGLQRRFSRLTRYDHYEPSLAALGEQPVLSQEIFADGTGDPDLGTGDYSVWGYQPRYEEYRHRNSFTSDDMRSNSAASLDIWHLGLDFTTRPVLNSAFIQDTPPVARILAIPSEKDFIIDCYFNVKAVRPMPRFGTPGMTRF